MDISAGGAGGGAVSGLSASHAAWDGTGLFSPRDAPLKVRTVHARAGLPSVDTLSHLKIANYQSTRAVNIANSSIARKSGTELAKEFRCFSRSGSYQLIRDPLYWTSLAGLSILP